MNIFADQNMPLVEQMFSHLGTVTRFDGRSLDAAQVAQADVLLTRSVTQVNEALLQNNKQLRFVGTATIGVDHIDQNYLEQRNIAFTSAPGCNAIAVAEYVISAILVLAQQQHFDIRDKTVAIVGVGNIGQCLSDKLTALGVKVLHVDPPRAQKQPELDWVELDDALAKADIVSFHVPLVREGEHKTQHLLNQHRIDALQSGKIIINASRGDVIDNHALLARQQQHSDLQLVLDVWENEPNILTELLPYVELASVHIAGHTLEGKARGTYMLYQALCDLLGEKPQVTLEELLPTPSVTQVQLNDTWSMAELSSLVHLVYDVRRDDAILRQNLQSQGFDYLRKNYPVRREFSTVTLQGDTPYLSTLDALGFSTQMQKD